MDSNTKLNLDFLQASRDRNVEALKTCIENGVIVNVQLTNRNTALHNVLSDVCFCTDCTQKAGNCLQLLLQNGANPSITNDQGKTPLDLVVDNMVPSSLGGLLDPSKEASENNTEDNSSSSLGELLVAHGGSFIATDRNSEKGIVNVELVKKLVKSMPGLVNASLDRGVKIVLPEVFDTPNEEDRGKPLIELDWSYIIYSKDADFSNSSTPNPNSTSQQESPNPTWYETRFLHHIMKSERVSQKTILQHPLVKAFLEQKKSLYWKYFGFYYFSWILVTFILYLAFIWTLYNDECRYDKRPFVPDPTNPDVDISSGFRCPFDKSMPILAYVTLILYLAGPLCVEIREIFAIGFKAYCSDWENYVIVLATFITVTTLFPALTFKDDFNFTWQYAVAAAGMFFGSLVILIQLANIPQIAIYVEMVFKIFQKLVLATLVLSPILIGFFFAFRILITDQSIGVFKLLDMIVSGSDYEEMLDHSRGEYYTVVAYLFFSAFIVLIIIVVMNFLVGLAVGDILELKNKAKLNNCITMIRNFYLMDSFFGKQLTRNSVTENGDRQKMTFKFYPFDKTDLSDAMKNKFLANHLSKDLKLELLAVARKRCFHEVQKENEMQNEYFAVAVYNRNVEVGAKGFGNNYNISLNNNSRFSVVNNTNSTNMYFPFGRSAEKDANNYI